MIRFFQRSLELKIIIAVLAVTGLLVAVFTVIDIRMMRKDTIHETERHFSLLAAAIKGGVNAVMNKGHGEDVQRILDDIKAPSGIDRMVLYDDVERVLYCFSGDPQKCISYVPGIPSGVSRVIREGGDQIYIHAGAEGKTLQYYSPIRNRPECFRCHDARNRLNGVLRMDFPLAAMDLTIRSRGARMLAGGLVTIAAITAALILLLRILVHKPVGRLRDAMDAARRGEQPPPLQAAGEDALSELHQRFLTMLNTINSLHRSSIERERELMHSKEIVRFRNELQTMFDAMPDGVLLVDSDMRIIQSNPRAYELLPGLREAQGLIDRERLKTIGCPNHGIGKALSEGRICEHQCKLTLAGGEERHLHSICAPIRAGGRVSFVVEVIRDITERIKTERELEEKTAELLAANRLLSQIAITDSLTQLANRRHFDEIFYKEVKRFTRKKYSSLSLLLIDIDHFKQLNDRYGHLAGDIALRDLAKILKEGTRETDTVARYGGEEFVIIMPDTRLEGAVHKAETLRRRVESTAFTGRNGPLHVTISIGVAACSRGNPHELIHAADRALYQAKNTGRNKVVADGGERGETSQAWSDASREGEVRS